MTIPCNKCGTLIDRPMIQWVKLRTGIGKSQASPFMTRIPACGPCTAEMVVEDLGDEILKLAIREEEREEKRGVGA